MSTVIEVLVGLVSGWILPSAAVSVVIIALAGAVSDDVARRAVDLIVDVWAVILALLVVTLSFDYALGLLSGGSLLVMVSAAPMFFTLYFGVPALIANGVALVALTVKKPRRSNPVLRETVKTVTDFGAVSVGSVAVVLAAGRGWALAGRAAPHWTFADVELQTLLSEHLVTLALVYSAGLRPEVGAELRAVWIVIVWGVPLGAVNLVGYSYHRWTGAAGQPVDRSPTGPGRSGSK